MYQEVCVNKASVSDSSDSDGRIESDSSNNDKNEDIVQGNNEVFRSNKGRKMKSVEVVIAIPVPWRNKSNNFLALVDSSTTYTMIHQSFFKSYKLKRGDTKRYHTLVGSSPS